MANVPLLQKIQYDGTEKFMKPEKQIHDGVDVTFFLTSFAYRDIVTFMLQLNRSMVPRKRSVDGQLTPQSWPLGSADVKFSSPVQSLKILLSSIEAFITEAPPDPGPRRFGNTSFRTWYRLVEERVATLFVGHFPDRVMMAGEELAAYLLGSFGSSQRLDYGTGHELSFLAFLGCLWKLDYFVSADAGVEERGIVLGVFEPYLHLIRTLIKTYNLEPAGSHGVWGLDDNSFLPYVFGSAQFARPISESDDTPLEGSLAGAPDPSSVVKLNLVDKEKDQNLYFSAIAFIHEVKKGPFWEHSPMLYDISGIKDGWGKINKGMIKMYNAEVLAKFPVVQHFPFGSFFRWERDPTARAPVTSTHTASQPLRNPVDSSAPMTTRTGAPGPGTAAPWAKPPPAPIGFANGVTQAPWKFERPGPPSSRGPPNTQFRRPIVRPARPAILEDTPPTEHE